MVMWVEEKWGGRWRERSGENESEKGEREREEEEKEREERERERLRERKERKREQERGWRRRGGRRHARKTRTPHLGCGESIEANKHQ